MSPRELPDRLLTTDADDIERRLITAIAEERPSQELRERMALAIGVPLGALGAASETAKQTATAASKAAAGASIAPGSATLVPWISVGALVLAVAGSIVGVREWKTHARPQQPETVASVAVAPVSTPIRASAEVAVANTVEAPLSPTAPPQQRRPPTRTPTDDLRGQIALIDAARAAVSASSGARALDLLRQYQDKYPSGTLRPEAAALKVEALVKLGRISEAQTLAQRFVADYGESPQSDRVMRIANLR